jgi:8-oxo-dGTP pyrophosphatase MutT (NUDIX family)
VSEPGREDSSPAPAAVLVPVFRDAAAELRLVLVVRGAHGVHGGQVALPGGKPEPQDRSLLDTALREAEEEIGLARSEVEVVAELEPVHTRATGFRVQPFLARVHGRRSWRVSAGEIDAVVTPRVSVFADAAARYWAELSFPQWREPRQVEVVGLEDGVVVWGLTLRLLDVLVPRLLAGEWAI